MADFKYEIKKNIAILSTSRSGWNRELNLVSWNEGKPKLDLRDWAPDHNKMSKGITLSREEAAILREVLNEVSLDELMPEQKIDSYYAISPESESSNQGFSS